MITKIQYLNLIERQSIIDANTTKTLIEEDNITEGNFLIFTDIKPLENQLIELNDNQMTLMSGMVDIYMSQLGL